MPRERELTVAKHREGTKAKADTWVTLSRQDYPNIAASIGINLDNINDSVVLRLPSGDMVEIYGDGELWFKGANVIRLATDELPWR